MTGSMSTRKQAGASRKKSINELKNGQWKKEFDETIIKYRQETDPEIKDSLKFVLTMMALTWGINNQGGLYKIVRELRQLVKL